jgi:hypothetical protein
VISEESPQNARKTAGSGVGIDAAFEIGMGSWVVFDRSAKVARVLIAAVGMLAVACAPRAYSEQQEANESVPLPPRGPAAASGEGVTAATLNGARPSAQLFDGGAAAAPASSATLPTPRAPRPGCTTCDASTAPPADTAKPADPPPAPPPQPVRQAFALGENDCNGGHCTGGYDDGVNPLELSTATKQCVDRGFARALEFSIGDQPGGRFCSYTGADWGCDDDCDGCNIMTTVLCEKP